MKQETSEEGNGATRRFRRVKPERVASVEDLSPSHTKVKVSMYLDLDVLNYFKERAAPPHAAPYQTQINNELRAVMERGQGDPYGALVNDERFIEAVAEKVRRRA